MKDSKKIIQQLQLNPHPEGGFFRETYRSKEEISQGCLGSDFTGNRNYCTCIYFLLTSNEYSSFHKIRQDEIWHYYEGSPIRLHIVSNSGEYSSHLIGPDIENDQSFQFVVPGNHWFAAEVEDPNSFSLVGCTVSPGFDFEDFQLAQSEELYSKFPQHKQVISRLSDK